jgi:hypothetical protein
MRRDMKMNEIELDTLIPKGGVITEVKDDLLYMTTTRTIHPDCSLSKIPINSYLCLPKPYKLPIRIDLRVMIDSPELYLLFGKGHTNFGTPWSNNRRIDDIIAPDFKPRFFHNHIPFREFVDLTVIYKHKEMQIVVNGEERYYSKKEIYMKPGFVEDTKNNELEVKISCTKGTNLLLKSIKITEDYDEVIEHEEKELPKPITRNEAVPLKEKPTFDACISLLSEELKSEIIKTNDYLLKAQPLKFKRKVEENKITYVSSEYGFSYTMFISNDSMRHSLNWYVIHNHKFKYKEKDYMLDALNLLYLKEPGFAEKMFKGLRECAAGGCMDTKNYLFLGNYKKTCNGRIEFKMCKEDFEDARSFISIVSELKI